MVIDLRSHGFKGRSRLGASTLDDLVNYTKDTFSQVASDKGVKANVVAQAVKTVTGIAPTVDTRDPAVTWVRTVPAHSKWVEAVFLKAVKSDPNAKPADLKIDVMPALNPILLTRILPLALVLAGGVFAVGYFMGKD